MILRRIFPDRKLPKDILYIMETSVYPREPKVLKELRDVTASHPTAFYGTSPDSGQLMALLLKLINARKTIEIGVYTGYSLLLTALAIPDDGKITAIDTVRETYEIGLPIIRKAGVEHKINFIHSPAQPVLDELLENEVDEGGSFDFAFVDADKGSYLEYHERLIRLVKVGGIIVYDNTLWFGTVAWPQQDVPESIMSTRLSTVEFNQRIAADSRVQMSLAPLGDGLTICRRIS
ncbi:hypothetical protein K2173_005331 [Erythroxylum novogranatense]|uniref:Caffeoyl-CoA O-methyltransferase n=1 Tax=Erythroxylum novogranatense TaxID=1862640 RepID=A0AAV8TIP4_9ROSI|nr:hypothetical protein K2173_005331 [Erythroxylum novogranatense]